jgi:putative chitinase
LSAFWTWKGLNAEADAGDFPNAVKKWNGGHNGMADRRERLAGNDPIIRRLTNVAAIMPTLERIG